MSVSRHTQIALLRGVALAATVLVAWWAEGLPPESTILRSALIGYAAFMLVGSLLTTRQYATAAVPLALLLGDLIAIGAVGAWLNESMEPRVAFLAGYLVGVLVAVVGRNLTSAILGCLAGAMTMGLTTALFAAVRNLPVDFIMLTQELVLLVSAAFLTARISGWLEQDHQRTQLAERVDMAVREREAEAAELVTFAQGLAASSSLKELGEATIRYLRAHVPVRAKGIAIVSNGEVVALWEEDGRLTEMNVERRRGFMQDALARMGMPLPLTRLEARSMGSKVLPDGFDFSTAVEVPIRCEGRVTGVMFLGDPKRAALEDARITVLADVARRVGQAVQRVERQGSEEHRRTALLLRQMREGVMLLGSDGSVLLANPAARQALGAQGGDGDLPPAIGEITLAELGQTPAGVSRRFRARIQTDVSGSKTELACTAVGILDGQKRIGTLVTLSDVTDEELARSRLVQSEKLTLVGQTLAGVAHELNNPLTALIGYADLLRTTDVEPRLAKSLEKIQEQAVRATRIVKNLLSVARQRNPERTMLDLGAVVNSVVELFAYEARLSNVKLDVEVPADLPKVLGDTHALQQIFVNLVQNAIHALKEFDGPRRIQIRLVNLPDVLLATVQDTGPGIPMDLRRRIWEPFFTTKGPNKGTGLGLALSKSIARDHGGDLILDDPGAKGARFVLRLPLVRSTGGTTYVADAPARHLPPNLRVLVVDDEKDVREAVVAALGRLGCQVTSTSTAVEAVRHATEHPFDVILADVRMPGTTGIEMFRILEEQDPETAMRVVFMTGDFTNEDVQTDVRSTRRPLLEKPFTVDDLVQVFDRFDQVPKARGATPEPAARAAARRPTPPAPLPPPAPRPPAPASPTEAAALDRILGQ